MFSSFNQADETIMEDDIPVSTKRIKTGELKTGMTTTVEQIDLTEELSYQLGIWVHGIETVLKKNNFTCNYEIKFRPSINKTGSNKIKGILKKKENSKYWEFKDSDVEYFQFKRAMVKTLFIILSDSQDNYGTIQIPMTEIQRFSTTTRWYNVKLEEKSPCKSANIKITLISE
eukprot:gene3457-6106_t